MKYQYDRDSDVLLASFVNLTCQRTTTNRTRKDSCQVEHMYTFKRHSVRPRHPSLRSVPYLDNRHGWCICQHPRLRVFIPLCERAQRGGDHAPSGSLRLKGDCIPGSQGVGDGGFRWGTLEDVKDTLTMTVAVNQFKLNDPTLNQM